MEALPSFEPITPPLVGMPAASTAPKKQSEGSFATIIVAVCVTVAVMVVIGVQLYVLWRSARHAVAAPRAHGSGAGMSRRGRSQGLKQDEIDAFPVIKWDPSMASGVDLESGRNSSGTTPLDDYAAGNLALVRCSSSPAAQGASSEPEYTRADDIEANAAVHALSSRAEPPMRSRPISLRHVPRARAWSHQQCSICVEAFVLDDELRVLPCPAKHKFHAECIDRWLLKRSVCPLCRTDFAPPEPALLISESEASGVVLEEGPANGVTLWECEAGTPDAATHPCDKAPQSPLTASRQRRDGEDGSRPTAAALELELELDVEQQASYAAHDCQQSAPSAAAATAVGAGSASAHPHAPLVTHLPPLSVVSA